MPDAGCWMPEPRCRIPEAHSEAWLAGWHSHPIAWLNRSWGRVWGGVGALKKGTILKRLAHTTERFWDSQFSLPFPSPSARLKPYFSPDARSQRLILRPGWQAALAFLLPG